MENETIALSRTDIDNIVKDVRASVQAIETFEQQKPIIEKQSLKRKITWKLFSFRAKRVRE